MLVWLGSSRLSSYTPAWAQLDELEMPTQDRKKKKVQPEHACHLLKVLPP